MDIQNQEKVLIHSVRSKRAFRVIYLPMYMIAVILAVVFAFLMSLIVRNSEAAQVSLEKDLNSVEYLSEDGKLVLTAEVNVAGRVVRAEDYSFTVKDESGKKVATGKNDAKGLIEFSAIPLTKAGEYVYTVSENAGAISDVVYDEELYTVSVELVKSGGKDLRMVSGTVTVEGEKVDEIRFLNTFEEPIREAMVASLLFGLFCLFIPIAILIHAMIHRRLRRASIVVTENRLNCRFGKKKKLDISLKQVKNLTLNSALFESISFVYAGQKRTVRFIQNRQEIFEIIQKQRAALAAPSAEGKPE